MENQTNAFGRLFRVAALCSCLLFGQAAIARDGIDGSEGGATHINCGTSCDASDHIDVNTYITTTVNQDTGIWRHGDIVVITDSKGNVAVYVYNGFTGRFAGASFDNPESDGESDGDGTSSGSEGLGGDGGGGDGSGSGLIGIYSPFDNFTIWLVVGNNPNDNGNYCGPGTDYICVY